MLHRRRRRPGGGGSRRGSGLCAAATLHALCAALICVGASPPAAPARAPSVLWPEVDVGGGLRASCHCRAAGPGALGGAAGTCGLHAASVAVAGAAAPALEAAVRAHLGPPAALRVVRVAEAALACGCGGGGGGGGEVAGSWGGDFGELLLAAAAVERAAVRPLAPAAVARLVRAYVAKLRAPLHYHTSAAAQAALARGAGLEALDMLAPPPAVRPALLRALAAPAAHGCALLRAALAPGGCGGVRPALVAAAVQALHGILWDEGDALRARIRYYVDASTPADIARALAGAPPVALVDVAGAAPGAGAPLPYGPLAGILTMPHAPHAGDAGSPALPWHLALDRRSAPLPAASALAPAPPPSAVLLVTVAPACAKLGRCALVAPHIPQPVPAAGAPRAPAFLILHPQVVSARRNATVPLLVTAFNVEGDTVKEAMADIAKEWDAAVERTLDIGGPHRPKVTILLS